MTVETGLSESRSRYERLVLPEVLPVELHVWAPERPSFLARKLPKPVRSTMTRYGLWEEPRPLKPSFHLLQVVEVLTRYGWCKGFDFSPTGRMCIRGAQEFLEAAGHVSKVGRAKSVNYMQSALSWSGVDKEFWLWNDEPTNTFEGVAAVLSAASDMARKNGD